MVLSIVVTRLTRANSILSMPKKFHRNHALDSPDPDHQPQRRRFLRCACCGLAAGLFAPQRSSATNDLSLPDIGDAGGSFTRSSETELGEAFFRSVQSQVDVSDDPELADYLAAIGQRLTAASTNPNQPFHFFLVKEPTINAFAGPGGYIGVHSALILATEAESELASVLSHEIAHVTQRHIYRAIEAGRNLSIPLYAGLIAALLLGVAAGGQAGLAALSASQAGLVQYQLNFTREHEIEADRIGIQTLAAAQFDPRSMAVFFEKLQQNSRIIGDRVPEFLRTHPVNSTRIAEAQNRAEQYPYRQYTDSDTYELTQAKLRVLANKPGDAENFFRAALHYGTIQQRTIARYGLGLALRAGGQPAAAREVLAKLVRDEPERAQYLNALAQVETDMGNVKRALTLYSEGLKRYPGHRVLEWEYSKTLLRAGHVERARDELLQHINQFKSSPAVYEMLAEVYNKLHDEAESRYYLVQFFYQKGDNRTAIAHAKLGIRAAANDFRLRAALQDWLLRLEKEERERASGRRNS